MNKKAIGDSWADFEREHLTREEIAASDLRIALMDEIVRARKSRGLTQRELEQLSGVRQPMIARLERGETSARIDTITKLLCALGMKLAVVPMEDVSKRATA
jgi:ribosome-binding protein aMBF1 (putative translation factor)